MASLLSTLFSSRDHYLADYIASINKDNTFPINYNVRYDELMDGIGGKSVLVTGGTDEERSAFLLGIVKGSRERTIILHNGNVYLNAERIRNYGVRSENWDHNIYKGMSKAQILSLLAGDDKDSELLFFYAYAFEVCEVLGLPVSIESISCIDWLGISWQQELLSVVTQRDRAVDLLSRFDKNMAEKAVKGMCRIERLTRGNSGLGKGIGTILSEEAVLVKEVYGSNSQATRQCFETIQALAESGLEFTLILDDVFLPDIPLIKDNYRNVRLIVSADDITQYSHHLQITNRSCSVIAFRHMNHRSAELISETYFGRYEKLINEMSRGQSKALLSSTTYNTSMTIRRGRELRLKPEQIVNLPFGCALVHLINGLEGRLRII